MTIIITRGQIAPGTTVSVEGASGPDESEVGDLPVVEIEIRSLSAPPAPQRGEKAASRMKADLCNDCFDSLGCRYDDAD